MKATWWGVCVVALMACGDDDGSVDGGTDAMADATFDVGGDDAGDAGEDASTDAGPPPEVEVTYDDGTVVGREIEGIDAFLAIPYAAPPLGDLRWRAPQPVEPWTEPRDASEVPNSCPQVNALTSSTLEGDEDCLYLNVFSPDVEATGMPVYVWIHGGGFIFGSGGRSVRRLAQASNTVVVAINYRLDQLGFLAHPAFEAEGGGTGNYGFLDQRAAMEWVRDNIEAFGGDPNNVTIAGESAGGVSVALHAIAPDSDGLFHRAIIQSGAPDILPLATLEEAQTLGQSFATEVGCDDPDAAAACLRALPVEDLIIAVELTEELGGLFYGQPLLVPTPNIDGVTLLEDASAAYTGGRFSDVPFFVGSNDDEGTLFHASLSSIPVADEAEYRTVLSRRFPDDVDAIVAEYPVSAFEDANAALTAVTGDQFNCATRKLVRQISDAGRTTWHYVFDAVPDGLLVGSLELGAYHSAELVYLFDLDDPTLGSVPDAHRDLQSTMQAYWTNFAATGDPNGAGLAAWPEFDRAGDQHLLLTAPPSAGTGYKSDACDFWEAVVPVVAL